MPTQDSIAERGRTLLQERYGDRATAVADQLEQWLSGAVEFAEPDVLRRHVEAGQAQLLFDAFWRVLPFGTGGRRGPVGYGPNRLNHATVALTIQGHCDYLRDPDRGFGEPKVVVANDVRRFGDVAGTYEFLGGAHPLLSVTSRDFARFAAEIYAANGVIAYLHAPEDDDALLTTPELSFAITHLDAQGGVNFSASHNPPDDNGAKVYDERGAQPVPPYDQELADQMEDARPIRRMSFAQGLEEGLIRAIPPDLYEEYKKAYVARYDGLPRPDESVPLVYTPLCGCGLRTVGRVLGELGFPVLVPPEEQPDGSFSVIPFRAPNPEVPQATAPARKFADAQGGEIVISSDPDADRVGVDVKVDGRWIHLTGNQIAAILTYFLMLDPAGPKRRGLVVETMVTTKLLAEIARQADDSPVVDDLLVGFKYVADVLASLNRDGRYRDVTGRPTDLVIAAEESHGVMVEHSIREKDATPAAMYIGALHQRLRRDGSDLHAYFNEVVERVGAYAETARSILAAGDEGVELIERIMQSVRDDPPRTIAGGGVEDVQDYWDEDVLGPLKSPTDKLSRNVVQASGPGFVVTIRPSGTEPKVKLYCHATPTPEGARETGEDALRRAEEIARAVYVEMLRRVDIALDEPSLLLPDIIQLSEKQRFNDETLPALRDGLEQQRFESVENVLGWLEGQSRGMTPGADPLPALKDAVAAAVPASAGGDVADELRRWATS